MATNKQFIDYAMEQLKGLGAVTYRKMFGEYMIYIDAKPVFLVCDNTVYIKMHNSLVSILAHSDKGYPYPGAKEHYVVDVDDEDLLNKIVPIVLPLIKSKK